jgi:CRISPR-associated protein Csm3
MRLVKYKVITGKIKIETGLHIGGSSDMIEIGGMDNPVLKHPLTGEPYIPGSSLKGKIRSLLELSLNKVNKNGDVHFCGDLNCEICRVFGVPGGKSEKLGPTRVIFRDAFLSRRYKENEMERNGLSVYDIVEEKTENQLNRITARATPRKLERVVPGVEFDFEIVYRIFDVDSDNGEKDEEFFEIVRRGMKLLEVDCLGGYGSRGSGKIKFVDVKIDEYKPEELKLELEEEI